MEVQPYLFFEGRAEEAIEFYKKVLGAEVTGLMRMKEAPDGGPPLPPGSENKVMHASRKIGDSVVMASDGMVSGKPNFAGVSLTISAKDAAEAERVFNALGQGGKVQMPLTKTFFAEKFGSVADKFGVSWMVVAGAAG
jgi:PhnB protein